MDLFHSTEADREQERQLNTARANCSLNQEQWRERHTHSQVMGNVVDRLKESESKVDEQQEQKTLDEHNGRRSS